MLDRSIVPHICSWSIHTFPLSGNVSLNSRYVAVTVCFCEQFNPQKVEPVFSDIEKNSRRTWSLERVSASRPEICVKKHVMTLKTDCMCFWKTIVLGKLRYNQNLHYFATQMVQYNVCNCCLLHKNDIVKKLDDVPLEDVPLMEFIYLVFTRTPDGVAVGDSGLCCCVSCLSSAIIKFDHLWPKKRL